MAVSEVVHDRGGCRLTWSWLEQAELARHRLGHVGAGLEGRQLDQGHPAGGRDVDVPGHFHGECGLSDAAGAGQRDQPRGPQGVEGGVDVVATADHRGQGGCQPRPDG